MRKENILTYNDMETIMLALMGRAMDEREAAEKARNTGWLIMKRRAEK